MRKFLAILLAVLMVVPAFAFTTSAEEATSADKLNIIPIITEYDMPAASMNSGELQAWKGPNGGAWDVNLWTAATGSAYVGTYDASERAVVRAWNGKGAEVAAWVRFGYTGFKPVDLSGIWDTGAVCFDLYLSDPDKLGVDNVLYDFELRSAGGDDNNEFNANGKTPADGTWAGYTGIGHSTLSKLYGGELQQGWNHFEIPLSSFGMADSLLTDDKNIATPDKTAINYFRIFNASAAADQTVGTEGDDHKIMMKNIYFVDQCVYEAPEVQTADVVDLWDCEAWTTVDGRAVSHADKMLVAPYIPGLMDVDNDDDLEWALVHIPDTDAAASGYLSANAGYNAPTGYTNNGIKSAIKCTPMTSNANAIGLRFDLYISSGGVDATPSAVGAVPTSADAVDSILDQAFYFQISSTGGTTNALSKKITLRNMFVGNHGEFDAELKLDDWNTVTIYFESEAFGTQNGLPATFDPSAVNYLRIYNGDNFGYYGGLTIAIDDVAVVYDYDEQGVNETDEITLEASSTTAEGDRRVGGYAGTKVKIMEEFPAGVTTVSVARNSTWFKTPYDATKGGTVNPDTICFDFYCDVNADATTGAEILAALTTKNWVFELASPPNNSYDACEMATTQSLTELVDLTVDQILAGGWHHVEIPLSQFATSTSKDGAANIEKYNQENGTSYDPYFVDMTALRHIGLFYQTKINSKGVDDTAFFYIDNVYFKDSTYVAPDAEITATVTPALSNSFNMSYEITGNEQVISNPVVEVTFDGQTTTQGSTFAFNNILAHRLSDTITTTVTALNADHQLMQRTLTYSIKQYAKNWLGSGNTTLNRLLSDMLYYGAAAQSLINYNTDDLASDVEGILPKTELDLDKLNSYKIENVIEDAAAENGPAFKSAALVLDSELAIRFAFTGEAESVTIGDEVYGSEDFIAANGYYYIDFPVSAQNFDVVYKAYFNGNADYALTYSVNHYLATKYKTTSPLADLYAAIYNYGVSADAYATVTGQND